MTCVSRFALLGLGAWRSGSRTRRCTILVTVLALGLALVGCPGTGGEKPGAGVRVPAQERGEAAG